MTSSACAAGPSPSRAIEPPEVPGGQSRAATQTLVGFLRDGTQPDPVNLLSPIAITADNISEGERLGELN